MTDERRPRGGPPPDEVLPALLRRRLDGQRHGSDGPWPSGTPRMEVRTASIRLPGLVGLLLAIPAFFLFGLIAIMLAVAGAVGMLIAPWVLRRMVRRMEAEVSAGDATIELDRTAYAGRGTEPRAGETTIELDRSASADDDQARAAINRSSSSRKRGSTSV